MLTTWEMASLRCLNDKNWKNWRLLTRYNNKYVTYCLADLSSYEVVIIQFKELQNEVEKLIAEKESYARMN